MSEMSSERVDAISKELTQWAAIAGNYWDALKQAGIPEQVAAELVRDWAWSLDSEEVGE